MFPLGLIFIELLYDFCTGTEREKTFTNARNGVLPQKLVDSFPEEAKLAVWMLQVGVIRIRNKVAGRR